MKQLIFTVTQVDQESMTYPEPTFPVQIDDPDINMFMIDDCCFDKVIP